MAIFLPSMQKSFYSLIVMGPLLFCLTIHSLLQQLHSQLRIFYLDDIFLGGEGDLMLNHVEVIQRG